MKYTPDEIQLIRTHAAAQQIAEIIGRSRGAVKQKIMRMGIRMMKHSDRDIELCRTLYDEGLNCRQIAEKMEIPQSYVRKIVAHIVRKPA